MSGDRQMGIYGAGGHAREVTWLLESLRGDASYEVVGYIEDHASKGRVLNGHSVFSWEEFARDFPDTLVTVAVGDPKTREKIVKKCAEARMRFATLIHRTVEISRSVEIGVGSIIFCGSILTVDIHIGHQVHINLDCTISHDVRIGDFSTLAPGVHVCGNVHIGRYVYVGTGATIANGTTDAPLTIGDNSVIGAGACVTRNVEPDCLYAGVPAEFKKRYAPRPGSA